MDHQHPFEKVTRRPLLFTGYAVREKYLAHARIMRLFGRRTWDEFLYDGWES